MKKLHQLYKMETGKNVHTNELSVTRMKGRWVFNASDQDAIKIFGCYGTIQYPDNDYILWLERKLDEYEQL